jgi:hypothetical protein
MSYSLRKWAAFAVRGDPTILHSLFTPAGQDEPDWAMIVRRREIF